MTKIVCGFIKKINKDPGFDRALSFICLDIVPASADEWPISANGDSEYILIEQDINYLDWKFQ